MTGYSISIFLPDGVPGGLRIARRSHWTGEILLCPRAIYPAQAKQRTEFGRTGVYVLLGSSADGVEGAHVYVGESDCIRERIKQHDLAKDFWDNVLILTKSDGTLHKADVRYLESELVQRAQQHPATTVENANSPAPPTPVEAHKADLDAFLGDALAIFRVLGVTAFGPGPSQGAPAGAPENPVPSGATGPLPASGEYTFTVGKAFGRMAVTAEGFVLRAGDGVAAKDMPGLGASYRAIRDKLRKNGVLVPLPEDPVHLRLTTDLPLTSASTAAAVLYGSNINGPKSWKDDQVKTLSEREKEAVLEP